MKKKIIIMRNLEQASNYLLLGDYKYADQDAESARHAPNVYKLCLWEKCFIICKPDLASLNKRNELISSCRHFFFFFLITSKPFELTVL